MAGTLLLHGLVFWFAKDITDANIQRNLGIANLVISLVGLAVALYARECGDPYQCLGTDRSIPACRAGIWFYALPLSRK